MILLTGATGYLGRFLLPRLMEKGWPVRCLLRPTSDQSALAPWKVEICLGDLDHPAQVRPTLAGVRRILHLAHIRYTPALVAGVENTLEHLVLVSSRRRFSQVPSPSVEEVIQGEATALRSGLPWTLLRPTMIYGPGDDRNLSRLAAHLRKHRWIPIFGSGRALQQPVHVEDVVEALLAALQRPGAIHRVYNLAGPEPLTYDQLIDQVGAAVGVRPVKLHLPVGLALAGLWGARRLGMRPGLEAEQVCRLQEDKSCSIAAARTDLGYAPRPLAVGLAQIYGKGCGP